MKIVWTRRAFQDRQSVYAFIGQDAPAAALMLHNVFEMRLKQLSTLPMLGRMGRKPGTRELVLHPHYLLVYDIRPDHIRILRLLHTARQWPPREI